MDNSSPPLKSINAFKLKALLFGLSKSIEFKLIYKFPLSRTGKYPASFDDQAKSI